LPADWWPDDAGWKTAWSMRQAFRLPAPPDQGAPFRASNPDSALSAERFEIRLLTMHVKRKLAALAALVTMMVTGPCLAADHAHELDALGALSFAPQACGIDIDRDALYRLAANKEADYGAPMLRASNRVAGEQASWTADQRTRYCEASLAIAKRLGIYRGAH
jgi:hypothetical protein